jgi:hypothetical protein
VTAELPDELLEPCFVQRHGTSPLVSGGCV